MPIMPTPDRKSTSAEDRIVARALLEMAKILVESDIANTLIRTDGSVEPPHDKVGRIQFELVEALYRRADELQPTADGEYSKYHEFGTEEFRRKYSK